MLPDQVLVVGSWIFLKPKSFEKLVLIFLATHGALHQASSGFGADSTFGSSANFGSSFGASHKFGASSNFNSQFGSSFGASSSGLHQYMSEAERLAKAQASGVSVNSGYRTGAIINPEFQSGFNAGADSFGTGSVTAGGYGGSNAGYKAKSWEKASKWSSQSEVSSNSCVGRTF